jgi:hypothetical protein
MIEVGPGSAAARANLPDCHYCKNLSTNLNIALTAKLNQSGKRPVVYLDLIQQIIFLKAT